MGINHSLICSKQTNRDEMKVIAGCFAQEAGMGIRHFTCNRCELCSELSKAQQTIFCLSLGTLWLLLGFLGLGHTSMSINSFWFVSASTGQICAVDQYGVLGVTTCDSAKNHSQELFQRVVLIQLGQRDLERTINRELQEVVFVERFICPKHCVWFLVLVHKNSPVSRHLCVCDFSKLY